MATLLFDTLKLAQTLRPSFSQDQAEALATATGAGAQENVATKSGLAELKAELKGEIATLKVDLVRWIVTAIAFNFVATAGALIAALKAFK